MGNVERWRIRSQFVGDDAWTHEAIVDGPPTPRDEFVEVVPATQLAGAVEALREIARTDGREGVIAANALSNLGEGDPLLVRPRGQ